MSERVAPRRAHTHAELAEVVDLVRRGEATTRPQLTAATGLGRNVVSAHLRAAEELALVEVSGTAPSSGGRAPETWRFRGERGLVLTACLGAAAARLALLDASGRVLARTQLEWLVSQGPEATLTRVDAEFDRLLDGHDPARLWGVGIGLPGPVEFRTGRPVAPPIMPGWDGFDVRAWFARRRPVGVWVDNDVNVMALGHLAEHPGMRDLIYVKIGTGIGAGLVSAGRLHRGGQGSAGDIGHVRIGDDNDVVCRCGRAGCLEAYASGWALERDAVIAQAQGRSAFLTSVMESRGRIVPADVGQGARLAEPTCVELTSRSAARIGSVLAVLVNFFNPSHVVIGGGAVDVAPLFVTIVERVVRERCIALATDRLVLETGAADQREGVVGCGRMVVDALMQAPFFDVWAPTGTPHGVTAIIDREVQHLPSSATPR